MSDYEDSLEYMFDEALASKRKLSAEVKRLRAENARLREALQPFVMAATSVGSFLPDTHAIITDMNTPVLTVGDLRNAAGALGEG
jgi:anti-sigma factor RsiW